MKQYEALMARFPFSDAARQSRLDIIYAYYRQHEKESAVDAADTFIRENPTHPRIDYAYYIKGLVYFEREPNFLEHWFSVDLSQRPPQDLRKSYEAFSRVVTQYLQSEYAADLHTSAWSTCATAWPITRFTSPATHAARGVESLPSDGPADVLENYDGAPAMRECARDHGYCIPATRHARSRRRRRQGPGRELPGRAGAHRRQALVARLVAGAGRGSHLNACGTRT